MMSGRLQMYLPSIGIGIFLILYGIAASLYPGGSQFENTAKGFSFMHNYWCNLLYDDALNGDSNPAQPFAVIAMIVLCLSITYLFYLFPIYFSVSKAIDKTICICGAASMLFILLIFTRLHDIMTGIASIFALIVLVGMLIALWKHRKAALFWLGILCLLAIAFNNYSYHTLDFIELLPLIQKFTFGIVLLWLVLVNTSFKKGASLVF